MTAGQAQLRHRNHAIMERYRDGATMEAIALEQGLTHQRVQQIVANSRSLYRDGLDGLKFGWLTVEGRAEATRELQSIWKCMCRCGATVYVRREKLVTGRQRSCGCRRADPNLRKAAASKISPADKHRRAVKGANARKWMLRVRRYLAGKKHNGPKILCGHLAPQRDCAKCLNRLHVWEYLSRKKEMK